MTEWRVTSHSDLVRLAQGLRALKWSWRLEEVPLLAEAFGWQVEAAGELSTSMDVGFGMDSGQAFGHDGQVNKINIMLTDYADEDSAGRDGVRDLFARYTHELTAAIGEPTSRLPGDVPEIRWAGPVATLILRALSRSILLRLITNDSLALQDLAAEIADDEIEDDDER